jgi:hypothetical protein
VDGTVEMGIVRSLRERDPSPSLWLREKVDDLGLALYIAIIFVECLIIWVQYA